MVDQLRRRLAFRFSNGLKNARLGDTAEIVVDGWSPPGLDHVEPDGVRQDIDLVESSANAVRRDTALIGAVNRLIKGVVLIGVGSRRRSASQAIDLPSNGGVNLGL